MHWTLIYYGIAFAALSGGISWLVRLVRRGVVAWTGRRRPPSSLDFTGTLTASRKGVAMSILVDREDCRELLLAEVGRIEKNFLGKGGRPGDWSDQLRELVDGEGGGDFAKAVERAHARVYSLAELEALADLRVRFPELVEKSVQLSAALTQAAEEAFRKMDASIEKSKSTGRRPRVASALPRSRTASRSTP